MTSPLSNNLNMQMKRLRSTVHLSAPSTTLTRLSLGIRWNQPAGPNLGVRKISDTEAAGEAVAVAATLAAVGGATAAAAPTGSAAPAPARAVLPTSILQPQPATGASRRISRHVSADDATCASMLPGFSMTRARLVPPSTAPLPKAGATVGNVPGPHCPAPGPTPGLTLGPLPAPAPEAPAAPVALSKASESTTPPVQPTGARVAETCAETRRKLRRRAILRQATKGSMTARPIGRQDPRVTRSRGDASLFSAAWGSRRQIKRGNVQEEREDKVLGTPVVPRVRGSRHSAYTRRVERKAFCKGALRTSCISALREKAVSQRRRWERGQGRGRKDYTYTPGWPRNT